DSGAAHARPGIAGSAGCARGDRSPSPSAAPCTSGQGRARRRSPSAPRPSSPVLCAGTCSILLAGVVLDVLGVAAVLEDQLAALRGAVGGGPAQGVVVGGAGGGGGRL